MFIGATQGLFGVGSSVEASFTTNTGIGLALQVLLILEEYRMRLVRLRDVVNLPVGESVFEGCNEFVDPLFLVNTKKWGVHLRRDPEEGNLQSDDEHSSATRTEETHLSHRQVPLAVEGTCRLDKLSLDLKRDERTWQFPRPG